METIFETKEAYLQFRNNFRKWYNTEDNKKQLTAEDFALYAALRGRDWRKCFTANCDEKKIESIWRYLTKTKFRYLFTRCFSETHGEVVTEEMIEKLRTNGFTEWGA